MKLKWQRVENNGCKGWLAWVSKRSRYQIIDRGPAEFGWDFLSGILSRSRGSVTSELEAKEACQSDFDARVARRAARSQ